MGGFPPVKAEDMYAARMAVVDAHRLDTLDETLSTSRILAPFEVEALKRTWNIDIHGSIGAGGVSSILLGTKDKEQVAVKLLAPDPRFTDIEVLQARFRKEYEIVSGLEGKAPVPKTFGIGDLFGRLFFVQQYLPYVSLAKWLRQTHTLEDRVNLARSLGAAYRRLHECGVVHRDIAEASLNRREAERGNPFRALTVQWDLDFDIAPGCNPIDGADHRRDMPLDARPTS